MAPAELTRRRLFTRAASRLIPDERDAAAVGRAWRNYRDAERGIERTDFEALAAQAREAWGEGDPDALSRIAPAADVLVAWADPGPGDSVLDAGAGDGNVALAAAATGATATAIELSPRMLALGRDRCERVGAAVRWVPGDLEEMPFGDGSFDAVLSSFGAMFAPRARKTVAELLRVAKPGAAVAMTAWASSGLMGRVLEVAARLAPPPRDAIRPARWGRFEGAYLWLGSAVDGFEVADRELALELESPEDAVRALTSEPGPVRATLRAAAGESRREAEREIRALVDRFGEPVEGGFRVSAAYVLITGRMPPSAGERRE